MEAEEILENKNIEKIYEDNHLIVVLKPAGIPSQGDKSHDLDMLTIIKEYLKQKHNKSGEAYLGLVHRLDRMTEGIMVFAKTSKAASRLSESIRVGNFKKRYLAVVRGMLQGEKDAVLENNLLKDEKNNVSRIVSENDKDFSKSKNAKLKYNILSYSNKMVVTYVEIELLTGRHHQIRVQFANIGNPLYGDIKYGGGINKKSSSLALFAYNLSFPHPTKDEWMEFRQTPNEKGIWSELKWK